MWNERYNTKEYAYGKTPNAFFKDQIEKLTPGKVLLPAEGEGRNAVYAARQGWDVYAVDQSTKGRDKALALAKEHGVTIEYAVADIRQLDYPSEAFDLIALTYVHMPTEALNSVHQRLISLLKPGGLVILEGFSTKNLALEAKGEATNGPRNPDFLFSKEKIEQSFYQLKTVFLNEETVILNEGKYHQGQAKVLRFIGKKP